MFAQRGIWHRSDSGKFADAKGIRTEKLVAPQTLLYNDGEQSDIVGAVADLRAGRSIAFVQPPVISASELRIRAAG